MRITKDHVPQEPKPAARRTLPEAPAAVWTALAVGGAALVATGNYVIAAVGVFALAIGCHRIGYDTARRGTDPRIGELTRERDHWRALAEYFGDATIATLGTRPPDLAAAARAGDKPAVQPDGGQPRPSARVRGGGRPGASGSAAAIAGLDAPLPGEDGGLTE